MPEVPYQKTDFGGPEGFARAVHGALMRAGLSDVPARILTAHSVVSTNWGKGVHNFNLAGMKASSSWRATKPYAVARSCECVVGYPNDPASKYKCQPGTGQKCWSMYWRAYASLDDGAQALLAAVQQPRYSRAYSMLLAGDTEYFAQVGRDGWYTANPASVKAGGEKRLATINGWLGEAEGAGIVPLAIAVGLLWYALA
jgi:hypothetical protein